MVHVVYTLISVMVLIDKKFARGGSKYDVYIYIYRYLDILLLKWLTASEFDGTKRKTRHQVCLWG